MALTGRPMRWVVSLVITCLSTGCDSIRTWHGDESSNPEHVLKVEVPRGATHVEKPFDPAVSYEVRFLMPGDQWQSYVGNYYPPGTLSEKPVESLPGVCVATNVAGLRAWSASGRIAFLTSKDATATRSVTVIPDCNPGQAYVRWLLVPPKASPPPPPT